MLPRAHHDGSPLYVSNQAPQLGESVRVRLRTHASHQPESVTLRTLRDGEPFIVSAVVDERAGDDIWWSAEITARNIITNYRWLLAGGAYAYSWLNARGLVDYDIPDADDFTLIALPAAPAWSAQAVVYQVFPDRFARRSDDDQEAALSSKYGRPLPPWAVPRAWSMHPEGRSANTGVELFGGDLDGVREHLEYIRSLGANTVYLTPVFPAGSTHRYDARTFEAIDPLLGGEAALTRLIEAAHAQGMRVLGDITLNHCGASHEWFVRAQDASAPERAYFSFDPGLESGYECWLGVRSLPKFDLRSEALRAALVTAPDSVIRRWVRGGTGFDGWRVDVANMAGRMGAVDVTHDLAREVRAALDEEGPDLLLVAEHGHDASGDLMGDGWHGTMNYAGFTRQVWCWLRSAEFSETFMGLPVEIPVISGHQLVSSIRAFHGRIPWRSLLASWNILGSHDTARIRTVVGTAERQIAAAALMIGLPGVPMVFAGDEIGATGWWGEDSRTAFPWVDPDSWEAPMLDAYARLLGLRAQSVALGSGGLRWVHASTDAIAFLREHPQERLLVVVARSQSEPIRLPLNEINADGLTHLFGFSEHAESGHAVIEIPSAGAGIWRLP